MKKLEGSAGTAAESIRVHGYPRIECHGALFNNRTSVLVTNDGEVDWGCFPNFDSLPVFFSLLDVKRGGFFRINPAREPYRVSQHYLEGTNILYTDFVDDNGVFMRLTDFLPTSVEETVYFSEIHRRVEAYRDCTVRVEFFPFDRQAESSVQAEEGGYRVVQNRRRAALSTNMNLGLLEGGVAGIFELENGSVEWFVFSYGLGRVYPVESYRSDLRLEKTVSYWKSWISHSGYRGAYRRLVDRSLLVLKGLFFEPTGFMVAAPTTSLPEAIQGERNWDYRFTWVRDTAYVIETLLRLGYTEEATRFLYSVIDRVEREGFLRSVYPVSAEKTLRERILPYEGYLGSKPVRFGNAASSQLQLDQYGSLINAVHSLMVHGGDINLHLWEKVRGVTNKILRMWQLPDSSIWEIRGKKRHYVYSKAVICCALRSAQEVARAIHVDGFAASLLRAENQVRKEIETLGVGEQGYYVQYYGGDSVDASLLRLPLMGYCDAKSPRFLKTLSEIERRLMVEDFLFRRYDMDDGLKGKEGAFLILSFWYIEDLVLIGKVERAKEGISKLADLSNSLGLYSEEIDPATHAYLGNYPQGLSHLGLVSVALTLERAQKPTHD